MKTVEIIVVGYHVPHLESKCINSIIFNTKHPYKITFIDNFNTGLSLTAMWNKLIGSGTCDYICLLNSDTEVSPLWLTKMMETLLSSDDIAFVGPSTNNCHSIQNTISSQEMADKHTNEIEFIQDPISGFCLLFKKSLWKKLSGFDERFHFYGAESMFIYRAMNELKLKSVWRKDVFIYHYGEGSSKAHNIDTSEERKKAKKMYREETKKYEKLGGS